MKKDLTEFNELPTLPHILLQIIEVCNRDDVQFTQLSRIIETDPALTAKILSAINSPYYNLPNKVRHLDKALVLIGMDAVKNIALCASIHQVFTDLKDGRSFHLKSFWKHSLMTAVLTRMLAEKIKYKDPDEAFLTGLLHDVGKLVLWTNAPEAYDRILAEDRKEKQLSEELKLGGLHSEIAGKLLSEWNLSTIMADAVRYHHEPLHRIVDSFALVKLVYVGNLLSREQGLECAEMLFGLSSRDIDELISRARADTEEAAKTLDIDIVEPSEETDRNDLTKSYQLAGEVKNLSLLLGMMQSLLRAQKDQNLVTILFQSLKILFGLKQPIFFRYDREKDLLISMGNATEELLIPFHGSASFLARSLRDRQVLESFGNTGNGSTLVDEQICRFFGKEGVICIPLHSKATELGVIAIGIDRGELTVLKKQEKLLSLLIGQFSSSYYNFQLRNQTIQSVQMERIAASAAVAKNVVHDARGPLANVRNYIEIVRRKLGGEASVRDELRTVVEEIAKVDDLLEKLSGFSLPAREVKKSVDLNQTIADISASTRDSSLKPARIALHLNLDNSLPPLLLQEEGIKQVVKNLLNNSVEAMPNGGDITISTRKLTSLSDNSPGVEESLAEITVTDNGPGIPETLRRSLFDPFVSSKTPESHQGLGLSNSYNLVKSMGGYIQVKSEKKRGTTLTVLLPIVSQKTEQT